MAEKTIQILEDLNFDESLKIKNFMIEKIQFPQRTDWNLYILRFLSTIY